VDDEEKERFDHDGVSSENDERRRRSSSVVALEHDEDDEFELPGAADGAAGNCSIIRTLEDINDREQDGLPDFIGSSKGDKDNESNDDDDTTTGEDWDSTVRPNSVNNNHSTFFRYSKGTAWLDDATDALLESPLGALTESDLVLARDVMAAWPRRNSVHAAVSNERLLKRIVEEEQYFCKRMLISNNNTDSTTISTRNHHPVPSWVTVDTALYVYVLQAWARIRNGGESALRATQIHDALVRHDQIRPSTESFNTVLLAWSVSAVPGTTLAVDQSDAVLTTMRQYRTSVSGPPATRTIQPNDYTLGTVLSTYAKSMMKPNRSNGTSGSGGAHEFNAKLVQRATQIFHRMVTGVASGGGGGGTSDGGLGTIECTLHVYTALINLYAESGLPDAADKTEAVVHRMQEHYKAQNNISIRPTSFHYNGTCTFA
jgi:hypothetical protein